MSLRLSFFLLVPCCIVGCDRGVESERPFLTRTFQASDGLTAHYVLFVPPDRDPAEKLPVILFLNGWGENGNDGLRQISNNLGGDIWRMRAWFPFLVVCPQCTYNAEWTPGSPNEQLALGVLDAAIQEFKGDPDRVTITGASTGGTGALNIAMANPERFAAVVPISAPIHPDAERLVESGLAVWNFYNGGDSPSIVESSRNARRRHVHAGNSPLVTEFNLPEHNAWDPAYSSPALYRWLLEQRRSTAETFTRFQLLKPEQLLAEWTTESSAWKAEGDELLRQRTDGALMSPPLADDWEIHFDLLLAAGAPAQVTIVEQGSMSTRIRLPLSDDGRAELVRSDSPPTLPAMVPIDPAAQRALRPGWNDVRIQSIAGRLSITLNGWPAIEDLQLREEPKPVRFAFDRGAPGQRIRYVRLAQRTSEARP